VERARRDFDASLDVNEDTNGINVLQSRMILPGTAARLAVVGVLFLAGAGGWTAGLAPIELAGRQMHGFRLKPELQWLGWER